MNFIFGSKREKKHILFKNIIEPVLLYIIWPDVVLLKICNRFERSRNSKIHLFTMLNTDCVEDGWNCQNHVHTHFPTSGHLLVGCSIFKLIPTRNVQIDLLLVLVSIFLFISTWNGFWFEIDCIRYKWLKAVVNFFSPLKMRTLFNAHSCLLFTKHLKLHCTWTKFD